VSTPDAAASAAPAATNRPTGRPPRPNATPGGPVAGSWAHTELAKLSDIKRDIVYCTVNEVPLMLDMYSPLGKGNGPFPAAVYVHGGGWTGGDKANGEGISDAIELVGRGYIVTSVNYRLAPQYKFPAQIEDVKCAIRHLRANAAAYHLDPNRIGVWGTSAGAHLASLLGLTTTRDGFEGTGGFPDQSSSVQAVVDMFGPANLKTEFAPANQRIVQQVFGASTSEDPIIMKASPVAYVSRSAPPFLILHGAQDRLVAPAQSRELYEKLTAAGGQATLVMVANAGHSFVPMGGPISPSRLEISRMVGDFFDRSMR
jgi:acetyl esterase/lipase